RLPAGNRRSVEHQAFCKGVLLDHADVKRHMLPLAAWVGETQVDVFDVVVLDRLQDVFGGLHEYPFGLQVGAIWPQASDRGFSDRGERSIHLRGAQYNIRVW